MASSDWRAIRHFAIRQNKAPGGEVAGGQTREGKLKMVEAFPPRIAVY